MKPEAALLLLLSLVSSNGYAGWREGDGAECRESGPIDLFNGSSAFEENKGQVRSVDGGTAAFVKYRLVRGGTQIFLLDHGVAYQFTRPMTTGAGHGPLAGTGNGEMEDPWSAQVPPTTLETYRMDMLFEGATGPERISTEGRSASYANYFQYDAMDVHEYTKVIYHGIYAGIDWVVYTTADGFKYDLVVHPGADPSVIQLRSAHHEEFFLTGDGGLVHGNRMGRFIERPPVSLQDGRPIPTSFQLTGDRLSFDVAPYDKSRDLIIDPARIWGTYYGGSLSDTGGHIVIDADNYLYMSGTTLSNSAIASGGYQNTFAGNEDAFVVKFDGSGARVWATYYGGSGVDRSGGCCIDPAGYLYMSGWTESTTGIAFAGHQNTKSGLADAYLVKFDLAGQRIWGTYCGGSDIDHAGVCAVDATGNVYMTGQTRSPGGMASAGHQNVLGGGDDGFIVKFDQNGTRLWATYYGGTGTDVAAGCRTDVAGNLYVTGNTNSTIGIAAGGFQNTFGGLFDAYLVKFDPDGNRLWATYYGEAGNDQGVDCALDADGNVYMSMFAGPGSGMTLNGHQNIYGGSNDAMLVKFTPAGERIWATYYGGTGTDQAGHCATDANNNVYLCGSSASSSGIAFNGHQNSLLANWPDGNAFLVKFTPDGVRLWGTYYGGGGTAGYGCIPGPDGSVYMCGYTRSTALIASGGQQNTYGGGTGDGFLVKFEDGGQPVVCPLALRCHLMGAYDAATGLMRDDLRTQGLLPASEPYQSPFYLHAAGGGGATASPGVYSSTGPNAIVDWVVVEIRDPSIPSSRLATRSALLQRDGDVVGTDGATPLSFALSPGNYHVAIRHRNHLGVMTATPIALSSTTTTIDFTNPATPTWGTSAQNNVSGTMVLWPGDVNFDGVVRYVGASNDRDPILTAIGGSTPTNVVNNVYSPLDVNMDGSIRYVGANNDRDVILQTIGGSVPTATRLQQLP